MTLLLSSYGTNSRPFTEQCGLTGLTWSRHIPNFSAWISASSSLSSFVAVQVENRLRRSLEHTMTDAFSDLRTLMRFIEGTELHTPCPDAKEKESRGSILLIVYNLNPSYWVWLLELH